MENTTKKLSIKSGAKKIFGIQEIIVLIPLVVLCICATLENPNFIGLANLGAMAKMIAPIGILAIGQSLIIIGGEFDISVGSMPSLGTVFFANAVVYWQMPVALAMLLTMALTVALSSITGFCVIYKKVPSFLASIAMLYVCKGAAYAVTDARQIMVSTPELKPVMGGFLEFGKMDFAGFNWTFIIFLILIAAFQVIMKKTSYGRSLYASGDNPVVARFAGINVNRTKMISFIISGCLVALVAILIVGKEGVASPKYGEGWELTVVAATAIGGISLVGGSGSMIGTMIGTFVMAVISNVLILFRVNQHYQSVILGIIIVLSVVIDVQRRKKLIGD